MKRENPSLERGFPVRTGEADTARMMEQRPLPDHEPEREPEPRLELVPALDDAEEEDEREERDEGVAIDTDPLRLYVRQIGDGRLLTPPEERELARRKDEGDEEAKRKLIQSNLRLVMSITRNYTNCLLYTSDAADEL